MRWLTKTELEERDPRNHLDECPGCAYCDHLMSDFYIACDECGHWMHRDCEYFYDEKTGETLCAQHEPAAAENAAYVK